MFVYCYNDKRWGDKMEDNALMARNLKAIISKRQIAHNVLAQSIGISTSTISRYINGQQQIPKHNLESICQYLAIDQADLYQITEEQCDIYIIGNGFELAHGMSTSPLEFLDFIKASLLVAIKNNINLRPHSFDEKSILSLIEPESFKEDVPATLQAIKFKSDFLNQLMVSNMRQSTVLLWSDIEQLYFKHLYALHQTEKAANKITELNHAMMILRELLISFILKDQKGSNVTISAYSEIFDLLQFQTKKFFINFNYTNLIENYVTNLFSVQQSSIINIHGLAKDNTLVFGYGGELTKGAVELSSSSVPGAVKYFKSNSYILDDKYSTINQVINTHKYRLHILGHSIGASDSMLLKSLFVHENLSCIKLYYFDTQEHFLQMYQSVNKIINNAAHTLKVVSPFSESVKMVQYDRK